MNYREAAESIMSICHCVEAGLQALGANSAYVSCANTRFLSGSLDIDKCLYYAHPNTARWDYAIGYRNESYYLEVHPAGTGEVETVIKKLAWLKTWLAGDGAALNAINAKNPFHWVASGKVAIPAGSVYAKRLYIAGLSIPKTRLLLS